MNPGSFEANVGDEIFLVEISYGSVRRQGKTSIRLYPSRKGLKAGLKALKERRYGTPRTYRILRCESPDWQDFDEAEL